MKVSLTVTIDVDPKDWAEEYGTEEDGRDVRQDVRAYFTHHILNAPAVSGVGLSVRVR